MSGEVRLPDGIEAGDLTLERGLIFWAKPGVETWDGARNELTDAFERSREAARNEHSFVYIVANDALLGRSGPANAMVAAGLLSGARTAAIEGWKRGWTANLIAYDDCNDPAGIIERATALIGDGLVTGELVHLGSGHIGKALA